MLQILFYPLQTGIEKDAVPDPGIERLRFDVFHLYKAMIQNGFYSKLKDVIFSVTYFLS